MPGEDPRVMEQLENVWKLLSRWIEPGDATLWRAASYRFHALVAQKWRCGRFFLAGDAAHQQPPFIGQGMCQGLRDVSNLAWKLDRVLKGRSGSDLLDTYAGERAEHVRELTTRIKAIGQVICERDPEAARARDARILGEGGGHARTITRQEIVPPLSRGLLSSRTHPALGTLFPQPWIRTTAGCSLLDAVAGAGWRIVIDGRVELSLSDDLRRRADKVGVKVFRIDAGDHQAPPHRSQRENDRIMSETEGVVARWFETYACHAVIVRPDHYIFGAAYDAQSLTDMMAELERRLQ